MTALTTDAVLAIRAESTSDGVNIGLAPPDFTKYTDYDLAMLASQVRTEQMHRLALSQAAAQISQINRACMAAQDIQQGSPWVQPTDATNAYPQGWVVVFEGDEWESLIPANTHQPDDPADPQSGRWWKNLTTVPAPGVWAPWTAYKVGDVVTYQNQTYKCLQAHTSQPDWTPPAVPALWQLQAQ
jgi:hypothetical protein